MKDYHTLEYSPSQKCFHYDQVSGMVEYNIKICSKSAKEQPGYVCIGIFETKQERDIVRNKLNFLFEITKLEKQMDAGTEIEKAYLNDYLGNRSVPDEYLDYCKAWCETHDKWQSIK